ncbi:hypothetical protein [Rhizobium leguminosarum]|uniref:hypothetical protein n=1 Tax=Rhizobium leguminosarum TaxID=384 RepID=UPI001C91B8BC|nr:hypothetical protein [Rhizobium leguminosarum]MBY2989001.1 hypothetical protein [Rhizobium leguminosarum]
MLRMPKPLLALAKTIPLGLAAALGFIAASLTSAVTIGEEWEKLIRAYGPADRFTALVSVIDEGDNLKSLAALQAYYDLTDPDQLIAECDWRFSTSISDVRVVKIDDENAVLVLGAYRDGCLIPIFAKQRTIPEVIHIGWPEYIYVHDVSPLPPGKLIEIRNNDRWGTGISGMGSSFVWLDGDTLRSMTLPSYLMVAGGYSFKSYLAEFLMRSDVSKVDGRVYLRRDGFVYECDQSAEQAAADEKQREEASNAEPTENEKSGRYIDTSWYLNEPECFGPFVTMKAMRAIGPEVYRYDPVSRQFDQIEGRKMIGGDLAENYANHANPKGNWFVKPVEIHGIDTRKAK